MMEVRQGLVGKTERIFYWLVHSLNRYSSQRWTRPNPGARSQECCPVLLCGWQGLKLLGYAVLCFPSTLAGSYMESRTARMWTSTSTQDARIIGGGLTCCATALTPVIAGFQQRKDSCSSWGAEQKLTPTEPRTHFPHHDSHFPH